ncbi:cell adhesion molecule Dscam2-like isoform X2 [Dreissena polymorpha]|uniref:cell adhesion molecule Dscam2-like isoform X2 n=1 Tax=Dreissena polymorpha TaxID=45954 RepID=UPI0022648E35|nr:cell adhesion molecule Dscam2-like isoform X2 [Dreissena polymorpha]
MLRSTVLIIIGFIHAAGSQTPVLLSNATFVDANGALKLTCTHSTGTVVKWFRKPVSGSQFDNVLSASSAGSPCLFDRSPLPDMFAGCDCAGSTFTCTLKSVSRNNDGDKWQCTVNTIPTSYSQELTIAVAVPVVSVTLTPDLPVIYVLQNVPISFIKCVSSEGRPTPIITWYMDKVTPSDYTDDENITERSIGNVEGDRTTSTLTTTPSQEQHGAIIYCKVSNGYGSIISVRKPRIDVLVAPSIPKVLYKNVIVDTITVIQNSSVSLECTSSGNPTPNISWKLTNGSVINNGAIELKFMQSVNAVTLTCTATSDMQPTSGSTTKYNNATTLLVNILYPPTTPTCAIENNGITSNYIRAIKNTSITINCTSNSHPPPMNYMWTLPGGPKQHGQLFTIPNVLSSGTYKLDVINVMNATSSPQVVIGNANVIFSLDMLFAVAVRPIANTTVLQNRTLSVECPYTEGNPPKTNFMWKQVQTSRVVGVEQNLTFQNMQITDEGFYKCRVNNTMEPSGCCAQTPYDETMFYVDVQYPSSIQRFFVDGFENARIITINQSQTVILICEAYSDPIANMFLINNTRNGRDLLTETHNNTISASLENVRCEFDKGIYQCQGNNIHNAAQQVREIEIIIRCAPRASPFMPPVPKVWTKTNSSVILTYTIVAYPPPRALSAFVWRKQVKNEWLMVNANTRINIQISQDRLQTNLSIVQVQKDDFATYTVNVDNDIGSTEQTFVIEAKEEPAIPEHFGIPDNTITDSSVIVEWKPGFNGGDDQWFVIGYKQHTGERWTYRTILEHIERISIEELVAGTSYQFKMYAENSIGKSAETNVITVTTRAKSGNQASGSKYDDLFNGQINVSATNTSSEYEAYRVDSQYRNQYETSAETSFHEYSALTHGGTQQHNVMNRASDVADNDCAKEENSYVNLVLSNTET